MVGEETTGLIDGEGPKLAGEHHQPWNSATFWAGKALLIGLSGGAVTGGTVLSLLTVQQ